MMLRDVIGNNIRKAREEKGLSQKEVGALFEKPKHPIVVCRWEKGHAAPDYATIEHLAEKLGKEPSWFFSVHKESDDVVLTRTWAQKLVALYRGFAAITPGIEPLPYSLTLLENTTDILSESLQGLLDESPRQEIFPPSLPTFTGRDVLSRAPRHTCLP